MASRAAARVIHTSPPRRSATGLVPAEPIGNDLLQAMTDMLCLENPGTAAEALRTLRLAYPHSPLALRLAALAAAMQRPARDPDGIYLRASWS